MLTVRVDLSETMRQMSDMEREQVPYATELALNAVAERARLSVVEQIKNKLHMPTEYAVNSMFLKLATKGSASRGVARDLSAMVYVKDFGRVSTGKRQTVGKGQAEVLGHLFSGGTRAWKGFEAALLRAGILPPGMAIVPGAGAPIDVHGNIPRGFFMQMMSYFKANLSKADWTSKKGYRSTKFSPGEAKVEYFVSRGRGNWFGRGSWKHGRMQHLPPGIWQREKTAKGTSIKPMIMFVRQPTGYRRYFDLESTVQQALAQHWKAEWELAWAKAMVTAGKLGPNATTAERKADVKSRLSAAGLG